MYCEKKFAAGGASSYAPNTAAAPLRSKAAASRRAASACTTTSASTNQRMSPAASAAATFWAGCGAIRKADFLAAGGFDAARYPHPSIEDIELGMRLVERGRAIWLAPDVQATHLKVWRLPNLLHTEIFRRALPWSRLLHARSGRGATLNVRPAERLRALLALALCASIPLAVFGAVPAWTPLALLAAALAANVGLFQLFRRRRGTLFALAGLLFHQVYYAYSAAAYAWAWLARGDNPSPTSSAR